MFSRPATAATRDRHRMLPGPPGMAPLLLWGRDGSWTYRVLPGARTTVRIAMGPEDGEPSLVFVRDVHPSVLARRLLASGSPGAALAGRRVLDMAGGREATGRAARAMARFTRAEALAFAGPGGEALARRIAEARALPLRNVPDPDPSVELMTFLRSPLRTYGTLDPLEIGRRARTRTGRWPASDDRILRALRGPRPIENLDRLVALASLPEAWEPGDEGEWQAFDALVDATAPLALLLGHFDFLAPSKGRWAEFLAGLGGADALSAEVVDALDLPRTLARQVAIPALFRAGLGGDRPSNRPDAPSSAIAFRLLARDKGLPAILELSRSWHARRLAVEALAEDAPDDAEDELWPVPFPPQTAPNGVRLACIGSARRLREEGDADVGLDHCVGGYADACATGRSAIVSLRSPQGRLSTLELVRRGKALVPRQHRGRNNDVPPDEAEAAAAWLLERLASGVIEPSGTYLAHAWRSRLGPRPYDLRSDAAFARAAAAWAQFLPRPLREPKALSRAVVEAARDLVADRPGHGGHPLLAPFGVLSDTGLCLYPAPLWGDAVTHARLGNIDGLRAALAVASRRLPPGLRDDAEPYVVVGLVCLAMVASGTALFVAMLDLGIPTWLAVPAAFAGPFAPMAAFLMRTGGRLRKLSWRLRVARALRDA